MLLAATVAAALSWAPLPAATLARTEVAAARVGGSIYVVGGFVGGGRTTDPVERYAIRRRSWRRVRPMPVALNHAVAVAYRGRLYVAGGANDSGSLRSLDVYDFARRRWRSGPDFPGPARNHTTGVATGGRFYVLAGRDAVNLASAERYNPRTRRWQTLPDMATPRGGIASVRLGDGRIVVFGGEEFGGSGDETISETELFNPRTGRWRRLPDMRTPRHGLGGAALGNRVFAVEGGPQPGLTFSDAIEFIEVPLPR
jgi:hypothetical protein